LIVKRYVLFDSTWKQLSGVQVSMYKQSNYLLINSYSNTPPLRKDSDTLTTYCYYSRFLLNCSNWKWIVSNYTNLSVGMDFLTIFMQMTHTYTSHSSRRKTLWKHNPFHSLRIVLLTLRDGCVQTCWNWTVTRRKLCCSHLSIMPSIWKILLFVLVTLI